MGLMNRMLDVPRELLCGRNTSRLLALTNPECQFEVDPCPTNFAAFW